MIDPNTAMEAAKEGATALTKLQEIIEKLLGPIYTRKQADADAYANQKKLNIIRDNPDMEIVFVDDKMQARQYTPEELSQRAQQRILTEGIRQERNLENVIGIAAKELSYQGSNISDASIDEDWITRLFSIVKDVNAEEMQYVWGKILAGEIVTPGSFSLRTLDTIRNIGKEDAQAFQKILPLVVHGGNTLFITSDYEILAKYNILYSTILLLDESGLLNSSTTLSMNYNLLGDEKARCFTDNRFLLMKNNGSNEESISFGIYTLTRAGVELFNVLEHDSNNEYILELAANIREKNKHSNIQISVHKINNINGDRFDYDEEPIQEFKKED